MSKSDLLRMANQIADFFEPYGETEAVAEIANHLRSFWTPVMRQELRNYIAEGGDGLRDLVIAAAAKLP